jgi:ankyrin repeat protein
MKIRSYFRYLTYLFVLIGFSCANAGAYEDLFSAIRIDDAGTVKAVFKGGFDPNTRDPKGVPALLWALQMDSPKSAAVIAEQSGLDVDASNQAGETALMLAALKGDLVLCQQLLQRGAAVNRPGWTPLHYAASGDEAKVVALLLERGASVDAESPNRTTPLMMAARYGSEAGLDRLLASGADTTRRNELGLRAVDFARMSGREFLLKKLAVTPP